MKRLSPIPHHVSSPLGAAEQLARPPLRETSSPDGEHGELDRLLADDLLWPVFQPIVELERRTVVGWEALTRGPQESALGMPERLFSVARRCGRLDDLEWACRRASLRGALEAGLGHHGTLFLNVEPSVDAESVPDDVTALVEQVRGRRTPVMVEITERELASNPAALLARVERYRRLGWGVALDDVGADPRSVALMPFVRPDVIKLDMRFVQRNIDPSTARTLNAVLAEAERSGARVLAEGIETEEHASIAVALGATLGQGWLFGHPAGLTLPPGWAGIPMRRRANQTLWAKTTPFEVLAAARPARQGTKRMLLHLSRQMEFEALATESAVVLSCMQDARNFKTGTAERYTELGESGALVAAFATGLDRHPSPGVVGVPLGAGHPLASEWDVLVLTAHFSGAFAARDLGDGGEDSQRRFQFVVTYDRELVAEAAASLLRHITPDPST